MKLFPWYKPCGGVKYLLKLRYSLNILDLTISYFPDKQKVGTKSKILHWKWQRYTLQGTALMGLTAVCWVTCCDCEKTFIVSNWGHFHLMCEYSWQSSPWLCSPRYTIMLSWSIELVCTQQWWERLEMYTDSNTQLITFRK